jgi:uncharacterized membrane protein YdjX (TVP38/TMEM64 family)
MSSNQTPVQNPIPASGGPQRWSPRRLWPLLAILAGIVLFFALGLNRYVSWSTFQARRGEITAFVGDHFVTALLGYMALYIVVVTLSIPVTIWVTMAGGLLFGAPVAIPLVAIAATTGATLVFFATRTSLGGLLEERAGPWYARLERGFQRDQWSYMLFLRLMPAVPFTGVNLAAGFLGVSPTCFITVTALGVLPSTAIFALTGAGIGSALDAGTFSLKAALKPELVAALGGLAVLATLPAIYRAVKRRREQA